MKIIFILEQFTPTEANKHLLDDVLFLRQQGFDAKVVTLSPEVDGETLYDEALFSKQNFSRISVRYVWDVRGWQKLVSFLSQEKPDLVILGGGKAKTIGTIAAHFSHAPAIFVFAHDEESIRLSQSFFDSISFSLSDIFIVASDTAKEKLFARGLHPSKVAVISDGIPFEWYGKRSERNIRQELGIPADGFLFLFVGDLVPEKGADILLRAFAKVLDGRLLIVGDGHERRELEALSINLGLSGRVYFLSSYPNIPELLMEAGAIIFPSKKDEPASLFVPALLSGVPVIVSDISGALEIIRNGENGIIVRKQDSNELAAAMKLVMFDPSVRETLQKNAKKGLEKFSLSAHCAKILSMVRPPKKKETKQ